MIGPNCMGVINTEPEFSLDATFSPTPARRGSIGFVSQSGALGVAVLNAAADLSVGLTQFVSMGNKADVSGNDLMEYWEDDPTTRVICMYLESFGNPRRFGRLARRVGRKKPVVVVKSGRTSAGQRAAASHTGSLASVDVAVDALFARAGVIRTDTLPQLFDVTELLANQPLPAGRRVAVLTNAGGPGVIATDALSDRGGQLAKLSPGTLLLPGEGEGRNAVHAASSGWSVEAVDYSSEGKRKALALALRRRWPQPTLVHHSDRGIQYASHSYRRLLERNERFYRDCIERFAARK